MYQSQLIKGMPLKEGNGLRVFYSSDQMLILQVDLTQKGVTNLELLLGQQVDVVDSLRFNDMFSRLTSFQLALSMQDCPEFSFSENSLSLSCLSTNQTNYIVYFNTTQLDYLQMLHWPVYTNQQSQTSQFQDNLIVHYYDPFYQQMLFHIYTVTNNTHTYIQTKYLDLKKNKADPKLTRAHIIKVIILKQYSQILDVINQKNINLVILEKYIGIIVDTISLAHNSLEN